jgi:5'-nucleotidase / UDP-sugar diphosphatase
MVLMCMVIASAFITALTVQSGVAADITAAVNVDPDSINLKSNGKSITAYIELPAPYSSAVGQIDVASVSLKIHDVSIPALPKPTGIGDYDKDGIPDLMVKFDRQLVQAHLFAGSETVTVRGIVNADTPYSFSGSDTVRVMAKGVGITILQTSDVHNHASGYGPFRDYTPLDTTDNDGIIGGYARLAAVIGGIKAEQAAAGTPVLLLDSGDFFMGTTYDLTASNPIALKFFESMGYDAITLGNHEFDWSPAGLAMLLSNGLTAGFSVPVLATNMVTSAADPRDNGIEALIGAGVIKDKIVIELSNGVKVGLIGLMGIDADEKAPVASPIEFDHSPALVEGYVDDLKNNLGADIVLAVSHGGVETDGSGDDTDLARDVDGIDIIASGHYHTATFDALVKGASNTIIFSPGEYGEWVSRLDIVFSEDLSRVVDYTLTLIPVDDTVAGNPSMQAMVQMYHAAMNASLAPLGVQLNSPISKTSFPLVKTSFQESGIGNLASDSLRAVATSLAPLNDGNPYHMGVVASGVIRDDIYPGKTGIITFTDIYNMLPLGISPDTSQPAPGYPLMSIYAKAADIYTICEVGLTLAPMMGSDYYLNFSGIRIDYNPAWAPYLQGVRAVRVCPFSNVDPFCMSPGTLINRADTTTLYHVVVDLYALQMLNVVNAYLPPGMSITPLDKFGNPINFAMVMNYRIDAQMAPGVQELKEWMAPLNFLGAAFPASGPGISPLIYGPGGAAMGRIQLVSY